MSSHFDRWEKVIKEMPYKTAPVEPQGDNFQDPISDERNGEEPVMVSDSIEERARALNDTLDELPNIFVRRNKGRDDGLLWEVCSSIEEAPISEDNPTVVTAVASENEAALLALEEDTKNRLATIAAFAHECVEEERKAAVAFLQHEADQYETEAQGKHRAIWSSSVVLANALRSRALDLAAGEHRKAKP